MMNNPAKQANGNLEPSRGGVMLAPVKAEAERFLAALGRRFHSFQTFDDNAGRAKAHAAANALREKQGRQPLPSPYVRVLHGTLSQHWNELTRLNALGAGVYVTVNQTNLRGR